MVNWVDIVVAIVLIYNLYKGFMDGMIKSIFGLIGYLAALIVAKIYYKPFATYLVENHKWFTDLKVSIAKQVISTFSKSTSSAVASTYDSSSLGSMNLPTNVKGSVVKFFTEFSTASTGGSAVDRFADYFSSFIINGLTFLILIIGIMIVIKVSGGILDSFMKLPVLKQVNQLSGIIFGGIKGCLIIYLIMTIVVFTSPIISSTFVIDGIQESLLGSFFYNYNIFLFVIDGIIVGNFDNLIPA